VAGVTVVAVAVGSAETGISVAATLVGATVVGLPQALNTSAKMVTTANKNWNLRFIIMVLQIGIRFLQCQGYYGTFNNRVRGG
jgi:hypothetical protein